MTFKTVAQAHSDVLEDEFRIAYQGSADQLAPVTSACDIDRLEFPSGRVRRIKALLLRALILLTLPVER
jgi:hypothetical protein